MESNQQLNGSVTRESNVANDVVIRTLGPGRRAWCVTLTTELLGARPVKGTVVVACPTLATNGDETLRGAFLRLCAALTPFRCIQSNRDRVLACALAALEAFEVQMRGRSVPVLVGVFQEAWGMVVSTQDVGIHDGSSPSVATIPSESLSSPTLHGYSLVGSGPFLLVFPEPGAFDVSALLSHSRAHAWSLTTLVDRASHSLQSHNIAEPFLVLSYGADGKGRSSKCLDSSNSPGTDREDRKFASDVAQVIASLPRRLEDLQARFEGPFRSLVDQLGRAQDALRNSERDGLLRQLGQVLGTLEEPSVRQRDAGSIRAACEQLRSILESQDVEVFQENRAFDPARHELLNPGAATGASYRLANVRSGLARNNRVLLKQRVTAIPMDVAVSIQPPGGTS